MHRYRLKNPEPLLPDIPKAPLKKRFISSFEMEYQKKKRLLASLLPVLKPEDLLGRQCSCQPPQDLPAGKCYANVEDFVRWFRRDQTRSANTIEAEELQLNFLHDMGHWLLEEGHLWEAEECYALAFEDFRFPSEYEDFPRSTDTGRGSKSKPVVKSQDDETEESMKTRLDIAWAMFGVAAGQNLWSRMAGLCRSGRKEDIRSVIRFKSSRKQMRAVRRPNYSTEDVLYIKKPWEVTGIEIISPRYGLIPESEASWQEGFLDVLSKKKKKKRVFKLVGFDYVMLEEATSEDATPESTPESTDGTSRTRTRTRSIHTDTEMDRFDEIMKGMEDLTKEHHHEDPKKSTVPSHHDYAKLQMERSKRMTQSVLQFSSTAELEKMAARVPETTDEEEDDEIN